MRTAPLPLTLAALLVLHGIAAAAPAGDPSLAATRPAEDLPARPRCNPLRVNSAAAPVAPEAPAIDGKTVPAAKHEAPTPPPQRTAVAPPAGKEGQPSKGETSTAPAGTGCRTPGCTSCSPQVPTCKPKWEDKKTKKVSLAIRCDFECVRPWEPYHDGACCEEKTTPCGEVRTKKKLYKTEEEKVERVLKYEVVMRPAAPCRDPEPSCRCFGCRCFGPAVARVFGGCH